jgi:hypothetical protein
VQDWVDSLPAGGATTLCNETFQRLVALMNGNGKMQRTDDVTLLLNKLGCHEPGSSKKTPPFLPWNFRLHANPVDLMM